MIKYEFLNRAENQEDPNLFEGLPAFEGDIYHSRSYIGNGASLRAYWLCKEEDFYKNRDVYLQEGFHLWQENKIGDNLFCTLVNGKVAVHMQWFPYLKQVRLIAEPQGTLPVRPEDNRYTDRGIAPSVTQLWTDFTGVDCGMSYAIQLCDGSFVVIDGGMSNHDEAKMLYDFLVSKTPAGEKPVIAGWILTHHHPDHVNCFKDFADRYVNDVTVEAIVYNNVSYKKATGVGEYLVREQTAIEEAVAKFPESTLLYKPHAGQVYHIRDAVFTCYGAQEDLHGLYLWNTNNTSVIFRMTLGDKSVLWLGDAGGDCSRHLLGNFYDSLKSDIVQIAHHGYGDAAHALYVPINAKIALWPVPDYRKEVIDNLSNFLYAKTDLETIYFAHDKTHTIMM